jgi:hypothetical protein
MARRPRRLVEPDCPTTPARALGDPLAGLRVSVPPAPDPTHAQPDDASAPTRLLADDA